jgi:uncharacterized coiled-coil protein SlyX
MTKDQKQIDAQKAVIEALQETIAAQERVISTKTAAVRALLDLRALWSPQESAELSKVPEADFGNIKLRPEVRKFAELMELKLRDNDHKRGWDCESYSYLFARLREEVEELTTAFGGGTDDEVAEEAADVANYCLMIADNIRNGRTR